MAVGRTECELVVGNAGIMEDLEGVSQGFSFLKFTNLKRMGCAKREFDWDSKLMDYPI